MRGRNRSAPLCRKLHRVPPFRDVLHFFALADLVNQFGAQSFGPGRVVWVIGAEAGGAVNLFLAGVEINDVREGPAFFAI